LKTRIIITTREYRKALQKLSKQGKDLEKLKTIIKRLSNYEVLPTSNRDHKLINSRNYIDCRECHIEPDWLLVYKITNDNLVLIAVDTGCHS